MSRLANIEKTANFYGKLIVERAQLELGTKRSQRSNNPNGRNYSGRKVSSDNLRKNLNFILKSQNGKFSVSFGAKGTAAKYAQSVHNGRRKGSQPPSHELVAWLKRRGYRAKDPKTGAFKETKEYHYEGMAYVIARSIGKYGVKEFPYYTMALKKYDTQLTDAILKAIELDVEVEFKDL